MLRYRMLKRTYVCVQKTETASTNYEKIRKYFLEHDQNAVSTPIRVFFFAMQKTHDERRNRAA